jgi:hypothetical protein
VTLSPRWILFGSAWVLTWMMPLTVRPTVKAFGKAQPAAVRGAKLELGGTRCKVWAGTTVPHKGKPRKVRFYAYTGPQGCQALKPGKEVMLLLLKAGPVYWVQLAEDYGHSKMLWFWDLSLAIPASALLFFLIRKILNRPPPKGNFMELLRGL